ncbi:hypothetical protein C8035_v003161 [Colletotrichum spinosum]|uniref:Uncharacterized protein n=1 Tax=Colletotrichum spinosum TaxID=1347390 RepID=A0A4R8Q4X7_9PEZI|nr:hypothetical protein C8035_v003161 [Colletotrichum spinosum]
MQTVAYWGVLLMVLSTQAFAAPSLHNHVQRHRDRVATHAHISHENFVMAKRHESTPVKAVVHNYQTTDNLSTDKTAKEFSSVAEKVLLWPEQKTAAASPKEEPAQDEQTVSIGQRSQRDASWAIKLERGPHDVDGRYLDAATKLLRAHAVGKHDGFRRGV